MKWRRTTRKGKDGEWWCWLRRYDTCESQWLEWSTWSTAVRVAKPVRTLSHAVLSPLTAYFWSALLLCFWIEFPCYLKKQKKSPVSPLKQELVNLTHQELESISLAGHMAPVITTWEWHWGPESSHRHKQAEFSCNTKQTDLVLRATVCRLLPWMKYCYLEVLVGRVFKAWNLPEEVRGSWLMKWALYQTVQRICKHCSDTF